jgi:hypothetical protein
MEEIKGLILNVRDCRRLTKAITYLFEGKNYDNKDINHNFNRALSELGISELFQKMQNFPWRENELEELINSTPDFLFTFLKHK